MKIPHRRIWSLFVMLIKPVFHSFLRWRVVAFLVGLVCLLLLVSGLNVLGSFVGRDFMTSLAERRSSAFFLMAVAYAGVFAVQTVVAVIYRFTEERLGLLWRGWLTGHFINRYLQNRAYYRISEQKEIDNPDQRITEDLKLFTATTISLILIGLNSTIAMISFSGVLISITPYLLLAAAGYATLGSLMTYYLGKQLVWLNTAQYKREADLRYELVLVREHAQPVALSRHESSLRVELRRRLQDVVNNLRRIISVNRNLGFFTTGYTYLIQIIPVLIVAPLYLSGQVEFGVVTQATIAFGHVLGAFSLIVNEFQRLSTFAAVIGRLGTLYEATAPELAPAHPAAETSDDNRIRFERLTLRSPDGRRALVKDLTLEVPPGGRLLIRGTSGCGKSCLLRAVAGLRCQGSGRVVHPPPERLINLPGVPFLTEGPLREQLVPPGREVTDADVLAALDRCGLGDLAEGPAGLDAEANWPVTLSPSEQQRLAFARLLLTEPPIALLDEATSALDPEEARRLYAVLSDTGAGYVTVSGTPGLEEYHDTLLELHRDGTWESRPLEREEEQEMAGAAS